MEKTFYWLPRILGILFTIFVSLFALDVFDGTFAWLDLFMHLLPSLLLLIVLVLSWKWERVGAVLWFLLTVAYVILTWGSINWAAYLAIGLPPIIMGVLFWLSSIHGSKSIPSQISLDAKAVIQEPLKSSSTPPNQANNSQPDKTA